MRFSFITSSCFLLILTFLLGNPTHVISLTEESSVLTHSLKEDEETALQAQKDTVIVKKEHKIIGTNNASNTAEGMEEDENQDHNDDAAAFVNQPPQGHWGTPSTSKNAHIIDLLKFAPSSNGSYKTQVRNGTVTGSSSDSGTNRSSALMEGEEDGEIDNDTIVNVESVSQRYAPPDSFTFTAKISSTSAFIVDPKKSAAAAASAKDLSSESQPQPVLPSIPFLECNNIGITTPSIQNQATFRHFPKSGATPTTYTRTRGMIIPLSPVEIKTKHSTDGNSPSSQIMNPGEVVWADGGEYMMTSPKGCDDDVSVLILNLDKKYIESQMSKGKLFGDSVAQHSCSDAQVDDVESVSVKKHTSTPSTSFSGSGSRSASSANVSQKVGDFIQKAKNGRNLATTIMDNIQKIPARKVILTTVGVSLSTFTAYFLSKVAPLQLAVGIGGACVVAGGTYATVVGGEWLCDEAENIWGNGGIDYSVLEDDSYM